MNPTEIPLNRYIGKCIYCGSEKNLTDEHVVPYGLKGSWKLLKASCANCSKITSVFERFVLRSQFMLPRADLKLPTYHPKKRPKEFSFEVERNGVVDNSHDRFTINYYLFSFN
jgi:hypothetical protein